MAHSILLLGTCILSLSLCSKRFCGAKSKEWGFRCFAHAKNGAKAKIKRKGRGRKPFSFPPHPRFIFCALPMFCTAKTRLLANLDGFLGFPFPKNAQERLLHRLPLPYLNIFICNYIYLSSLVHYHWATSSWCALLCITLALRQLHWLPVIKWIRFKILLLPFKAIHSLSPPYISELITVKPKSTHSLHANNSTLPLPPAENAAYTWCSLLCCCCPCTLEQTACWW